MANIADIVKQVVKRELAPAQIVDLTVEEAVDADGDPIWRIKVVFKVAEDRLDPEKVLGLVRHLRGRLDEFDADRFPILSFMTAEEATGAAA